MTKQAIVTIGNKEWITSLADTPWELAQGLGGITEIPQDTGMLFDMGFEQIIHVTTVPMLFPLDIAFLSEDMVVTEIYRDIQPGYLVTSTSTARYFLEVNAGELDGVDIGSQASVEILASVSTVEAPDWVTPMISLMGLTLMAIFVAGMVVSKPIGVV